MNRYALIFGGRVVNVVMADTDDIPGYDHVIITVIAGPRWIYVPGVGFSPPEPDSQIGPREITRLQFYRRFTRNERNAIRVAAQSSENLDDFLFLISQNPTVDLNDTDIATAVTALETAELIAAGRADQILSG